jgi:hypothetical protein
MMIYVWADLAYRFTLPTDGWAVDGAVSPGFRYTKNLLGLPSGLQPGDQVIAIESIPAEWQMTTRSPKLRESWQTGNTLDYTVRRDGQEIHVPVTLARWQLKTWLLATLREPTALVELLAGCVLLALAVFVFLLRPGNLAADSFLIIMAILVFSNFSESLPGGFAQWIDPVANTLMRLEGTVTISLFPYVLIQFSLVFPHPKPIYFRLPWLAFAVGIIGLLLNVLASESPIGWLWFLFSLVLAVAILIHNALTMRDAVSRAQIRWGLGGVIFGFGTLTLMFLGSTAGLIKDYGIFNMLITIATTVMGSMLAVAILRYRLFDIDVIIRKTLVYTLLSGLLGLVYFGSVVLLQNLVGGLAPQNSPLVIVFSTLLIAALFNPLRRRIQEFIDRRFYRRKYDAEKALAEFAAAARSETDLEQLTTRLTGSVRETLQPAHTVLWLIPTIKNPKKDQPG